MWNRFSHDLEIYDLFESEAFPVNHSQAHFQCYWNLLVTIYSHLNGIRRLFWYLYLRLSTDSLERNFKHFTTNCTPHWLKLEASLVPLLNVKSAIWKNLYLPTFKPCFCLKQSRFLYRWKLHAKSNLFPVNLIHSNWLTVCAVSPRNFNEKWCNLRAKAVIVTISQSLSLFRTFFYDL